MSGVTAAASHAGRGTLTMPSNVAAKIAAQAASELPEVGAASGGVLGIGARRDFDQKPKAEVQIHGQSAVVSLDIGLNYPIALREAADTIRSHVGRRVEQLTGLTVEQVDVKVSWLRTGREGGAKQGGLK